MSESSNSAAYLVKAGPMSDADIIAAIKNDDIMISSYENKNLTPLGYNLTPTRFVFSIKKRTIEKIHEKDCEEYVNIRPSDTVLILSRESLFVSQRIMGTFHSKVGMVSSGFGHIGTTLDPLWEGPLLFAINNPTAKRIKLVLSKIDRDTNLRKHKSFVTVIFQSLVSPATTSHDNPLARMNILRSHIKGKYFAYKHLRDFCEEISALNTATEPLVKEVRPDLYHVNGNTNESCMDAETDAKKYFNTKYGKYIENVNNAVDKILKINIWIRICNMFKKYWWVGLLLSIFAYFIVIGLIGSEVWPFSLLPDETISKYKDNAATFLLVGFPGFVSMVSIILMKKFNEHN